MSAYSKATVEAVKELLDIGIALSAEKNSKKLLEMILREARRITQCDAGTLFLLEKEQLVFKIIQNDKLNIYQGGFGEKINLPPLDIDATTVAGYCALNKKVINIPDVYAVKQNAIDFSGPRRYDCITGYHTKSMLVVPLEDNEGEIIGVLQLLNAQDEQGQVIPFACYIEQVVCSIASQAAVAISNMRYVKELDEMLHAFVRVISTAIDERSPYNANHTRNMTRRAGSFAHYLKKQGRADELSEEVIEQLIMSAWLHDIGKIAIPLEIMDKPTRLGEQEELLYCRLMTIREQRKVQLIKKAMKEDQLKTPEGIAAFWIAIADIEADMDSVNDFLAMVNNPSTVVDANMQQKTKELAERTWSRAGDKEEPWLLPVEVEALMVPCGTLTENERHTIENHVGITRKMLDQIPFGAKYCPVPGWACSHHEFLDGSGYPRKLKADELPIPVRILTIMDIYDALTACDRPYRSALPPEKAFAILSEMANAGKLDAGLVSCFKESQIWMD